MNKSSKEQSPISSSALRLGLPSVAIGSVLLSLALGSSNAHANGFSLGDAANYAVLYEGHSGHNLQINNGPGPGGLAVTGNIGIGGTGVMQLSGPVTIDGNVNFAGTASDNGPYSGNIVVNGSITGGVSSVQTDLDTLDTLSNTLGSESGASIAINTSSGSQTINVSSGTSDGSGNSVFNVTAVSFDNNQTLTINGNGSESVVFNINANSSFNGTIVLTGGITSDQVLFNFPGGNDSQLKGGDTLQFAANGATLTGVFLDPDGTITMDNAVLDGRLFGGDSTDMQIVSGSYVDAPTTSVPDGGTTVALLGIGLTSLAVVRRKVRSGLFDGHFAKGGTLVLSFFVGLLGGGLDLAPTLSVSGEGPGWVGRGCGLTVTLIR